MENIFRSLWTAVLCLSAFIYVLTYESALANDPLTIEELILHPEFLSIAQELKEKYGMELMEFNFTESIRRYNINGRNVQSTSYIYQPNPNVNYKQFGCRLDPKHLTDPGAHRSDLAHLHVYANYQPKVGAEEIVYEIKNGQMSIAPPLDESSQMQFDHSVKRQRRRQRPGYRAGYFNVEAFIGPRSSTPLEYMSGFGRRIYSFFRSELTLKKLTSRGVSFGFESFLPEGSEFVAPGAGAGAGYAARYYGLRGLLSAKNLVTIGARLGPVGLMGGAVVGMGYTGIKMAEIDSKTPNYWTTRYAIPFDPRGTLGKKFSAVACHGRTKDNLLPGRYNFTEADFYNWYKEWGLINKNGD